MYVLDAKDLIIKVWMEVYACIVWIFFPHMCLEIWKVGEFEWLGILINDISWHIFEISVLERRNEKNWWENFLPSLNLHSTKNEEEMFSAVNPFLFLALEPSFKSSHISKEKSLWRHWGLFVIYLSCRASIQWTTPFRKKLITETKSFWEMSLKGTFSNFIRFYNLLSTQHIFT